MRTAEADMWTPRGWERVALSGGCPAWADCHDCGRDEDHPGDHVCVGCHDQWNRDPQLDAEDARGEWDHMRPELEDRCSFQLEAPC